MKSRVSKPFILFSLLAIACAGCVNLDPQSDPTRFYVLPAPVESQAPHAGCERTVLVGPVRIGGGADQAAILEQTSPTEVRYLEWDRWAEPPAQALPRALVSRLANILPEDCVLSFRHATPSTNTIQLEIEVTGFGITPDNHAFLSARWRLKNSSDISPRIGATAFNSPFEAGTNRVAAGVAGLGKTLDQLAARLANELGEK